MFTNLAIVVRVVEERIPDSESFVNLQLKFR